MEKIFINPEKIDFYLVRKAAEAISQGGIVALPTETVYGLAARADKREAVGRLYQIKQRPKDKPFTYAVADKATAVESYFSLLPPFGYRIIERFWPGPLTLIYYSRRDRKIGVRVPHCSVTYHILEKADCSVFLPSANLSGEKEAASAEEVEEFFDGKIDLVVDAGSSLQRQPSTVVDLTYHPFKVVRKGVVPKRRIVETFIKKRIVFVCTGNTCRSPMAELLLEKYLAESRPYFEERYEILSCGTSLLQNTPISSAVAEILKNKEGLNTDLFSSQRLRKETILSSDLIFAMEDAQINYILKVEPTARGRVFPLKKFLPSELERDIPDPIGRSREVYEKVYMLIKKAVLELKEWI